MSNIQNFWTNQNNYSYTNNSRCVQELFCVLRAESGGSNSLGGWGGWFAVSGNGGDMGLSSNHLSTGRNQSDIRFNAGRKGEDAKIYFNSSLYALALGGFGGGSYWAGSRWYNWASGYSSFWSHTREERTSGQWSTGLQSGQIGQNGEVKIIRLLLNPLDTFKIEQNNSYTQGFIKTFAPQEQKIKEVLSL